jgi:hypothetical protein
MANCSCDNEEISSEIKWSLVSLKLLPTEEGVIRAQNFSHSLHHLYRVRYIVHRSFTEMPVAVCLFQKQTF